MQWSSTVLCSLSDPAHGTGSDSTRSVTLLYKTSNEIKFNSIQSEFQVGFTTVLDYITYTWVKDDEVAFNEELIQVRNEVNKG